MLFKLLIQNYIVRKKDFLKSFWETVNYYILSQSMSKLMLLNRQTIDNINSIAKL